MIPRRVAFGLPSRIGGRKRERVVNRFDIVCDDRRAPHHTTFSPKLVTLTLRQEPQS